MPSPIQFPSALSRSEWLLTNGLGGFAMGTASGIPDRRYHAWLVAATKPPLGRIIALHSCAEWLMVEGGDAGSRRYDLTTFSFTSDSGPVHSPEGLAALRSFERRDGTCRWEYAVEGGIRVVRTLSLSPGANACSVRYEVFGAPGAALPAATLMVRPFVPLRDFHHLDHGSRLMSATAANGKVEIERDGHRLVIEIERGKGCDAEARGVHYAADERWWSNFFYAREVERGLDGVEDLYTPGVFTINLSALQSPDGGAGPACSVTLHAHVVAAIPPAQLSDHHVRRPLLAAAGDFVARRTAADGESLTSIIAGYPWFSDWGRDTFISMRGLLLCTGRFDEARRALVAFARMQRRGLIPNCFDNAGNAEYNTVDASLWFVHAACEYVRASGDAAGFDGVIGEACMAVVAAYRDGTDYGIRMDSDGLIAAGDEGTQLTWMDARRDGVVFTPRHGKAVEINALWYSILLELASVIEPRKPTQADELRALAQRSGDSFAKAFWNEKDQCLFDVLIPTEGAWRPDRRVRPNQIFAVSQPHSPLSQAQRQAVVARVKAALLTPQGLRTLEATDPQYQGRFDGALFQRDSAYHNGTVWPWLIGPYAEAVLRVGKFSAQARAEASRAIDPLLRSLEEPVPSGPIGQIAEVYDGDEPRRPQGCPAQAWSVAEVLRALSLCERGEAGGVASPLLDQQRLPLTPASIRR